MTIPSINDAKKLAMDLRAHGVIILAFDGSQVGGASFGHLACSCGLRIDRDEAAALVIEARALAVAGALNLRRNGPLARDELHALSPSCETGSPAVATQ